MELSEKEIDEQLDSLEKEAIAIAILLLTQRRKLINKISDAYGKESQSKLIAIINKETKLLESTFKKRTEKGYKDLIAKFNPIITSDSKRKIQAILDESALEIESIVSRLDKAMKKAVLEGSILDLSNKKFEKQARTYSAKQMRAHINTVINSAGARMVREAIFVASINDFRFYRYAGPKDNRNREYCAQRVNKIYERSEAKRVHSKMQTLWNCRHWLQGVDDADAQAKPD